MNNKIIKSSVAALWGALAFIGLTTSAMGTTQTWSGLGGNTTFSTPGNWVSGVAPVTGDDVIFTGSSHQTCNMAANISLDSITFDANAASFTITATSSTVGILTITSTTAGIVNNSGVNQSFANTFTQTTHQLYVNTGTGGGIITFSGELGTSSANFSAGMTVTGNGTMKITFAGGGDNIGVVTINSGATQELKDYTDFGDNLTTESLTLNGGTIQVDGAYSSGYTNHFLETAVTLGTGGGTFSVPTGQSLVWISTGYTTPSHITIGGGAASPLTIAGGGTFTMASPQANTYTGGTIVAGKLTVSAVNNYGIACVNNLGAGPVTVNSGGLLTLATGVFPSAQKLLLNAGTPVVNLTGANTASQLSFDGGTTFQASGVWGSPTSGAPNQDTRFTGTGTLTVTKGPTTTGLSLTAGTTPSIYGNSLGFTATVTGSTPGGTVQFQDGGVNLGSPVIVAGGSATLTISTLGVAIHSITAIYSGDAANIGSTSSAVSQEVDAEALSVTANDYNKTYGQTAIAGAGSTAFTSSGLQNGESIGTVTLTLTGTPTGGGQNDPVGTYPILPSAATGGTFAAANYNITYNTGNLVVSPLAAILTGTRAYDGTTNTPGTVNAAAALLSVANTVPGDGPLSVTGGPAILAGSAVGTQLILSSSYASLVLSGTGAANYSMADPGSAVTITNPNNAFSIYSSTLDGLGDLVVCWQAIPGVTYNVFTNTGLGNDTWADVGAPVSPTTATATNWCVTIPGVNTIGNINAFVLIKQ